MVGSRQFFLGIFWDFVPYRGGGWGWSYPIPNFLDDQTCTKNLVQAWEGETSKRSLANTNQPTQFISTMSGNSRSREFPGIPASNSRPESREWNLPLAFPFPKMGMEFSICIPVPVNGNEIFLGFPGNSREFSVPESRERNFLFICIPVPENGNGICHFPFPKSKSHSRSWLLADIPHRVSSWAWFSYRRHSWTLI